MSKRQEKPCQCAGCRGLKSADPLWGFDRRDLLKVKCGKCGQPIGRARYVIDAGTARFGTLLVTHRRCVANPEALEAQAMKIAVRQGFTKLNFGKATQK